MLWIWVSLLVLFVVVEALTAQLVTIWFAIGSLAALIASFFTESIVIQIVVFAVVSLIALAITRPIAKKITASKSQATNADMYIGKEGVVSEEINNLEATGIVKVKGSVWTARSEDDKTIIPAGTHVEVLRIEGVKLIVRIKEEIL